MKVSDLVLLDVVSNISQTIRGKVTQLNDGGVICITRSAEPLSVYKIDCYRHSSDLS